MCGELDENDVFEPAYYFPYFQGSGISTYSEIAVERKIEKNSMWACARIPGSASA